MKRMNVGATTKAASQTRSGASRSQEVLPGRGEDESIEMFRSRFSNRVIRVEDNRFSIRSRISGGIRALRCATRRGAAEPADRQARSGEFAADDVAPGCGFGAAVHHFQSSCESLGTE